MYLATWPVIRCFVLSSYVITIIVHLRLPASSGAEPKGTTVYKLNQLLTKTETQYYLETGLLPRRFRKYAHPEFIEIGTKYPVKEKRWQRRKHRPGYYAVPRWKYVTRKVVPDIRLGSLMPLNNRMSSYPTMTYYAKRGPGGRNEEGKGGDGNANGGSKGDGVNANGGSKGDGVNANDAGNGDNKNANDNGNGNDGNTDGDGKKDDGDKNGNGNENDGDKKDAGKGDGNANDDMKVLDGGGRLKKFSDIAKKAMDKVPKMNGKGVANDENADENTDDTGGGTINQLKEKAKNAYGKMPGAKSVGAMFDKGKNNGLGQLKKLNGMMNNGYDRFPIVGRNLGKSADGPGMGQRGKEAVTAVNELVKNNEVTKAVGDYLLGLVPGGKVAEATLAAKDKFGNAVKKRPRFRKKKKTE